MRKLIAASVLALGTLCAVPAWSAQPIKVQEIMGPMSGIIAVNTQSATSTVPIGTGHAVVGTVTWYNAGTFTNVQVGGTNATIDDTVNGTAPGNGNHIKTFHLLNVTGNPNTVTVNFSNTVAQYVQITWQEVYPLASLDVHSAREVLSSSTAVNGITTAAVTTAQADYVYGSIMNETGSGNIPPSPGTGFTAGVTDNVLGDWNFTTENLMQSAAGSQQATFTSSNASDNWLVGMLAFKLASYPQSAVCPVTTTFPNTSTPIHTVICPYTVTTSDGTGYTGTTVATPGGEFEVSASTGNANLAFSRALVSTDTSAHANLNFTENGVSLNLDVPVPITVASVASSAGPLAIGWKAADPTGQIVFTSPKVYNTPGVDQILLHNNALLGSAGSLHVYKMAPGIACTLANVANLTSLHNGDFDLNGSLNQNQVIAPINNTLAVADSVCVLTKDGSGNPLSSPGSMQGTLSVTVN